MRSGSSADGRLRALIRTIPDFPRPGVRFRDITPLLGDPAGFRDAVDALTTPFEDARVEAVTSIESRGFLFAGAVALRLGAALVPLRKAGRLPADTVSVNYDLEYGKETLEAHRDGFRAGQRVLIVDDVLATGGTAAAAFELIRRQRAEVIGFSFLLQLTEFDGRTRLEALGASCRAILDFP